MGLLSNFIKDREKRIYKQHKAIYNKEKRIWLQAIGLGCNRKILTFRSCARHEDRGKKTIWVKDINNARTIQVGYKHNTRTTQVRYKLEDE